MIESDDVKAFEQALNEFKVDMLSHFEAKIPKYGPLPTLERLQGDSYNGLIEHFFEEVNEFATSKNLSEEAYEAVDVANMAFLIWWRGKNA